MRFTVFFQVLVEFPTRLSYDFISDFGTF